MNNRRAVRSLIGLLFVTLAAPSCIVPIAARASDDRSSGAPVEGLGEVIEVVVEAEDGTDLHGWVGLPDEVGHGARVPVALVSTPYLGDCFYVAIPDVPPCDPVAARESWVPGHPSWWDDEPPAWATYQWGTPPIELIRRGYAAAFFSVRGTGKSGGCLEFFGSNEQRDQVALVEWAAQQAWSTGQVAMGGDSYAGTTALEAAIESTGPRSPLKAVVAGVPITDAYTTWHTPQGGNGSQNLWGWAPWPAASVTPPAGGGPLYAADGAQRTPDRVCADVVKVLSEDKTEYVMDERDARFWGERALIQQFPDVTAAVLFHDGFRNLGQATQDSAVWTALGHAPKRQIQNQRDHGRATAAFDPTWEYRDWPAILFGWLDYWLKGAGDRGALRLGLVDYLDDAGTWRVSRQWPPAEAREEVMYLAGDDVRATPGSSSRTFRSVVDPRNNYWAGEALDSAYRPWAAVCGDQAMATGTPALTYVTEPLSETATIAGNPLAYLRISSDQPGGLVQVQIAAIRGDQPCDASGNPIDAKLLALGVADLRYHAGNLSARPFAVGEQVNVRIDLWDLAETVPAGHRVAVVVSGSGGAPIEWTEPKHAPEITVHETGGLEASHVVLPMVAGTLGGAKPRLAYPPRPFVPRS